MAKKKAMTAAEKREAAAKAKKRLYVSELAHELSGNVEGVAEDIVESLLVRLLDELGDDHPLYDLADMRQSDLRHATAAALGAAAPKAPDIESLDEEASAIAQTLWGELELGGAHVVFLPGVWRKLLDVGDKNADVRDVERHVDTMLEKMLEAAQQGDPNSGNALIDETSEEDIKRYARDITEIWTLLLDWMNASKDGRQYVRETVQRHTNELLADAPVHAQEAINGWRKSLGDLPPGIRPGTGSYLTRSAAAMLENGGLGRLLDNIIQNATPSGARAVLDARREFYEHLREIAGELPDVDPRDLSDLDHLIEYDELPKFEPGKPGKTVPALDFMRGDLGSLFGGAASAAPPPKPDAFARFPVGSTKSFPVRGYALSTLEPRAEEDWADDPDLDAVMTAFRFGKSQAIVVAANTAEAVVRGLTTLSNIEDEEAEREAKKPRDKRDSEHLKFARGASRELATLSTNIAKWATTAKRGRQ